jgi:hypothetical protein
MTINNPIPVGDNPQWPIAVSEAYLPDQLVIGNLNLVTDTVQVFGTTPLLRGTPMGQTKFGTAVASAGKAAATNSLIVAAEPVTADTITFGANSLTTAITFNSVPEGWVDQLPPPGTQWISNVLPYSTAAQAAALVEYLNSQTSDPVLGLFTYAIDANNSSKIDITSTAVGTAPNAFTLATSDATAFTVGGSTFSGGAANTGAETIGSISAGPQIQSGNYTIALTSTTAFTVTDPHGEALPPGVVGTAYKNAQLNFTVTTGAGIAAGDQFILTGAPTAMGVYKLCQAGASDGSEVPVGLLTDFCDPTQGGLYPSGSTVTSGVYLGGEFNGNFIANMTSMDPSWNIYTLKQMMRALGIFIKFPVSADDPT